MCGRYVFVSEPQELRTEFPDLEILGGIPNRESTYPGMDVAVLRKKESFVLSPMRWGLIPSWAKDHATGFKTFNARSETVTEKPTFRTPFKRKRCLLPLNGYFEWKAEGKKKIPHYFSSPEKKILYAAALFDEWEGPAGYIESCTMLTTAASEIVIPIHDRMPVFLGKMEWEIWLEPSSKEKDLLGLLRPTTELVYERRDG